MFRILVYNQLSYNLSTTTALSAQEVYLLMSLRDNQKPISSLYLCISPYLLILSLILSTTPILTAIIFHPTSRRVPTGVNWLQLLQLSTIRFAIYLQTNLTQCDY